MARALIATNDGLMLECLRNGLEIQVEDLVATLKAIIHAGISREASNDVASFTCNRRSQSTSASIPQSFH